MVETLPLGRFQLQQQRLEVKRCVSTFLSSHKTLFTVLWIAAFASVFVWQRNVVGGGFSIFGRGLPNRPMPRMRPVAFNLTDFGAVGDGVTLNTEAFERAVFAISKLGKRGGGQLNVPPGRWLTAPFNLTSHMTLFLAEDSEILGVQVGSLSLAYLSWVVCFVKRHTRLNWSFYFIIIFLAIVVTATVDLCSITFFLIFPYERNSCGWELSTSIQLQLLSWWTKCWNGVKFFN